MNSSAFISRARELVLDNLLNSQFGVASLAKELGISRSELYKRIKKIENKSASQFIREIRLDKALELLKEESHSIGEISYMVGFNSPTYFSTSFKEHYGYSPSISKQNGHVQDRLEKLRPKKKVIPLYIGGVAIIIVAIWSLVALGNTSSKTVDLSVDRSTTLKAYSMYLEARELIEQRKDSAFPLAVDLLEKSIDLDPTFAEAYAEMSFLYGQWHYYGSLKKQDRDKLMRKYVDLAMDRDPESPEVLLAKADLDWKNRNFPKDTTAIITAFQRVLDTDEENDRAHYRLYQVYRSLGKYEISHEHLERATALVPENYFYKTVLGRDLFWKKNEKERAMELIEDVIRNSERPGGVYFKALFMADSSTDGHVDAFKIFHNALKENKYLYGYLYWNTLITMDLDLLPLAEKYSRLIQIRYPENTFYTYENAYNIYIAKKRYDDALDLTIIWNSNKGLSEKAAIANLAKAHYLKGDLNKAEELLLESFGDLFDKISENKSPSVYIAQEDIRPIWTYLEVLRQKQDKDRVQELADFLCSYYEEFNDRGFFAKKFDEIDCLYQQNDLEGFLAALRDGYFNKGNRLGVYRYLKMSRYSAFEDEPAYRELMLEIEEDTHRMRTEVIDYLKKEGHWDTAWDRSLEYQNRDVVMK